MLLSAWMTMAALSVGCGGTEAPRRPIFGSVTVDGAPLQSGMISFFPTEGTGGPSAMTTIANGSYRFTTDDGPYAGVHQVMIDVQVDSPLTGPGHTAAGPNFKEARSTETGTAPNLTTPQRQTRFETKQEVPRQGELRLNIAVGP
jgi:hypothetical protein